MDMSFSLSNATPVARGDLQYPALLAMVGGPPVAAAWPAAAAIMPVGRCLVTVILGRTGWREAAICLEGRFTGPPDRPVAGWASRS